MFNELTIASGSAEAEPHPIASPKVIQFDGLPTESQNEIEHETASFTHPLEIHYQRCKAQVEQLEEILLTLSEDQKFEDDLFPPDDTSLYIDPSNLPNYALQEEEVHSWRRCEALRAIPCHLFAPNQTPSNISIGILPSHNFISAASTLALYPHLLEKVFVSHQHFLTKGIAVFQFFLSGEWRVVAVDTTLPCIQEKDGTFRPAYSHCERATDCWLSLLEKAYAKLHQNYESIIVKELEEILLDLTAGVAIATHSDSSIFFDANEMRSFLSTEFHEGNLLLVQRVDYSSDDLLLDGIPTNVSFGILDIINANDSTIVRVRDYWGLVKYTGALCETDSLWQSYGSIYEAAISTHAFENSFYLLLDDFIRVFNRIDCCKLLPDSNLRFSHQGLFVPPSNNGGFPKHILVQNSMGGTATNTKSVANLGAYTDIGLESEVRTIANTIATGRNPPTIDQGNTSPSSVLQRNLLSSPMSLNGLPSLGSLRNNQTILSDAHSKSPTHYLKEDTLSQMTATKSQKRRDFDSKSVLSLNTHKDSLAFSKATTTILEMASTSPKKSSKPPSFEGDTFFFNNPQFFLTLDNKVKMDSLVNLTIILQQGEDHRYPINFFLMRWANKKEEKRIWEFVPTDLYRLACPIGGDVQPLVGQAGGRQMLGAGKREICLELSFVPAALGSRTLVIIPVQQTEKSPGSVAAKALSSGEGEKMPFYLRVFSSTPMRVSPCAVMTPTVFLGEWRRDSAGGRRVLRKQITVAAKPGKSMLSGIEESQKGGRVERSDKEVTETETTKKKSYITMSNGSRVDAEDKEAGERKWTSSCNPYWCTNPQYIFQPSRDGKIKIILERSHKRVRGRDNVPIGFVVSRLFSLSNVLLQNSSPSESPTNNTVSNKKKVDHTPHSPNYPHASAQPSNGRSKAGQSERKLFQAEEEWYMETSYHNDDYATLILQVSPEKGPYIIVPSLRDKGVLGNFSLKIFSDHDLEYAHKVDETTHQVLVSAWTESTAGGSHLHSAPFEINPAKETWKKNPKFALFVRQKLSCTVTMARSKQQWKRRGNSHSVDSMMGLYVFNSNTIDPTNCTDMPFIPGDENSIELVLEPMDAQPYIIMCCTLDPGQEGNFVLRVTGNHNNFTLEALP